MDSSVFFAICRRFLSKNRGSRGPTAVLALPTVLPLALEGELRAKLLGQKVGNDACLLLITRNKICRGKR
jgi:hypothetical protein